jgi:hypothetical protein
MSSESFAQIEEGVPANFRFSVSPDGTRFAFPWVRAEGKWFEPEGVRYTVQTEWYDLNTGKKLGSWRCSFRRGDFNGLGWDGKNRPVLVVRDLTGEPARPVEWRVFSMENSQGRLLPPGKLPDAVRGLAGVVPNPKQGLEERLAESPSLKDLQFHHRSASVLNTAYRVPIGAPWLGLVGWYDEHKLTVRRRGSPDRTVARPLYVRLWTNLEISGWPFVALRIPDYRAVRDEFRFVNASGTDPYMPSTILVFDLRSGATVQHTEGVMAVPLPWKALAGSLSGKRRAGSVRSGRRR